MLDSLEVPSEIGLKTTSKTVTVPARRPSSRLRDRRQPSEASTCSRVIGDYEYRSANTVSGPLRFWKDPTAVQVVAEGHEALAKILDSAPVEFAVFCTTQRAPFQRSANVTEWLPALLK
jgi:hypothetical protein